MTGSAWLRPCLTWAILSVLLTLLVQARLLSRWDNAVMRMVAESRPPDLLEPMNWIFRLGFAQVDAAVALMWGGWNLVGLHRGWHKFRPGGLLPWTAIWAPLLLFAVIGVQAGARLVVDQPGPGRLYELNRPYASHPIGNALDRTDAVVRGSFVTATAASGETGNERGSFPSGHAARVLFLGLLMAEAVAASRSWRPVVVRSAAILMAGLVGYSTLYFGYHWPSDLLGGYMLALVAYYPAASLLKTHLRHTR